MKIKYFLPAVLFMAGCGGTPPQLTPEQINQKISTLQEEGSSLLLIYSQRPDSVQKAYQLLKEAVALDETNVLSFFSLAKAQNALGQPEEVMKTMDKIIQLDSLNQDAYLFKAVLSDLDGKKEEAAALYNKTLTLLEQKIEKGGDYQFFYELGKAFILYLSGHEDDLEQYMDLLNKRYKGDVVKKETLQSYFEGVFKEDKTSVLKGILK